MMLMWPMLIMLVVLCRDLSRPPLCTIYFPWHVPYNFHGVWTPLTFGLGD
jgi:carotenoid cleavage dioxygenase-like enzyme